MADMFACDVCVWCNSTDTYTLLSAHSVFNSVIFAAYINFKHFVNNKNQFDYSCE